MGTVLYSTVDGIPCAYFSGSQCIQSTELSGFPIGSSNRTMSAWIRPTNNTTESYILSYGTSQAARYFGLDMYQDGIRVATSSNNSSVSVPIDAGVWYNIVATYNGTNLCLYCDGVLIGVGDFPTPVLNTGNDYVNIGGGYAGDSWNFPGYVAACRIYDRILSDKEIKALASEFVVDTQNSVPVDGLILRAPLREQQETAETGQSLTYHGEISHEVVDGIECAKFNPEAGSYISFDDEGLPDGGAARAISILCRLNSYSDPAAITISYGRGGESGIALEILPDGAINVSNIQTDAPTDSDAIPLNTWCHIVATVEYNEDDYFEVKIYMNGQLLSTDTDRYFDTSLTGSSGQIAGYNGADYLVDGYLADCRIYDRVLSEQEISALHRSYRLP